MSEQPQSPDDDQQPETPAPTEVTPPSGETAPWAVEPPPPSPSPEPGLASPEPGLTSPEPDHDGAAAAASDRPEIPIGVAFAGGFVVALILKRLAR